MVASSQPLATLAGDGGGGFAELGGGNVRAEWLSAGAFIRGPVVADVDGDGADEVVMAVGHAMVGTANLVVFEGLTGSGTGSVPVIALMRFTPMVLPRRSSTLWMSPSTEVCTRRQPRCTPAVNFTSMPCSMGLRKYMIR